jgi:hypothetical protein
MDVRVSGVKQDVALGSKNFRESQVLPTSHFCADKLERKRVPGLPFLCVQNETAALLYKLIRCHEREVSLRTHLMAVVS